MSNKFSSVLQITDLDDFITPSQECIKPLEVKNSRTGTGAKVKIKDNPEIGHAQKLEKVQITLNDCLACSGCITSAESILINQQNFGEIIKFLEHNQNGKENNEGKLVVVSMSIQPIVSLAQKYEMDVDEMAKRLAAYFRKMGADKVVEMSLAEDLALLESKYEFLERYKNKISGTASLPMLSSSCPGWICYAEKTHGNFILPYVSTTKSPQQIMGSLIKYNMGYEPDKIYHITLMPCFDKKLEASRNEFFNNTLNARDVDCVITTIEMEQLLNEEQTWLVDLRPEELDYPWGRSSDGAVFGHSGSGSGGFAHHILTRSAQEIFGLESVEITWQTGKNPDLMEAIIAKNDSNEVLRFAVANGFRNIQNIVQKMKKGKCTYDYVEIMACPGGCLNGGAQIKPSEGAHTREHISRLEGIYAKVPVVEPERNKYVKKLYDEWLQGSGSDKCFGILRTSYHPVEKSTTALNIKW